MSIDITSRLAKFLSKIYYNVYGNFVYLITQLRYVPGINIPDDSMIYWRCRYVCPAGIHIGHNTIISNDAFLDGRCGIYIGNNVLVGAEVRIYTMKHDITSPTFAATGNPVHIKDWTYIANRVTILEGVTIGEGAVVASGAVVTKDVEPWTVVGGIPAKFIKRRPIVKDYRLNTQEAQRIW